MHSLQYAIGSIYKTASTKLGVLC